jgi:hypothetical protein
MYKEILGPRIVSLDVYGGVEIFSGFYPYYTTRARDILKVASLDVQR